MRAAAGTQARGIRRSLVRPAGIERLPLPLRRLEVLVRYVSKGGVQGKCMQMSGSGALVMCLNSIEDGEVWIEKARVNICIRIS